MPPPSMLLTLNFSLAEMTASQTAIANGIDNIPTAAEIENLRRLCVLILQPARDALGPLKINSAFRNEKVNKLVGGVANSDHRLGYAADVVPFNVGTRALAVWVVKNCSKFDQVILEFGTLQSPKWIHVSASPRNRKQVLRAETVGGKTVYTAIKL